MSRELRHQRTALHIKKNERRFHTEEKEEEEKRISRRRKRERERKKKKHFLFKKKISFLTVHLTIENGLEFYSIFVNTHTQFSHPYQIDRMKKQNKPLSIHIGKYKNKT